MNEYSAHVTFTTGCISADNEEMADRAVDALIEELGQLNTKLSWDDVSWTVSESN